MQVSELVPGDEFSIEHKDYTPPKFLIFCDIQSDDIGEYIFCYNPNDYKNKDRDNWHCRYYWLNKASITIVTPRQLNPRWMKCI